MHLWPGYQGYQKDFGWLLKIHREVDGYSKQRKSKGDNEQTSLVTGRVPGEKGRENSWGHFKMALNSSLSLNLEIMEGIKNKH